MKRGEIDPITNKIFSHIKGNGKIQWYSQEAWNKRKETAKKFNKSENNINYQKEWYQKNKEKRLKQSIINSLKRTEEFPLKSLLSSIKSGAKLRKIKFNIDYNFIINQWDIQKGKCYYTNVDMNLTARKKEPFQVSIDRIDSSKGYTEDNAVLCCQSINYMKNDYSLKDFTCFLNKLQEALKLIKTK